MIHPSLLFPHVHFETNPDYDFIDKPIHMILPYFPVLKAQDTRNSAVASDANKGYELQKFDKITQFLLLLEYHER